MSGPDDSSTLTLKAGKDFDVPWLVFYGNPAAQRRQMLEAFGAEDQPDLSLVELAAKFAVDFQAVYTLAKSGATQTSPGRPTGRRKSAPAEGEEKPLSYGTRSEPEAPQDEAPQDEAPQNPLLAEIEAASDPTELRRVWASNQDAFRTDKEIQAAYKAKSASFKK